MSKKGQVTFFVIIAIVIVVAVAIIYQFAPNIKSTLTGGEINPQSYITSCLEDTLEANIKTTLMSGGEFSPDHPYTYHGEDIDYVVYTSKNNELGVVESPMIFSKIEKEIANSVKPKVSECFSSLVRDLENKGYSVNLKEGEVNFNIKEDFVELKIDNILTVSKEESKRYEDFTIDSKRNIYQLIMIGYNIMNWETNFGNADTNIYMEAFPNIKAEKIRRGEGTKIYIISDKNSDDTFRFATRSLAVTAESFTNLAIGGTGQ